jgi:hypothetical protein
VVTIFLLKVEARFEYTWYTNLKKKRKNPCENQIPQARIYWLSQPGARPGLLELDWTGTSTSISMGREKKIL